MGKKASGGQQKRKERTPGKAAGAEKTAQTKKAGAFSVSGVLRVSGSPKANTSVQVREVPEQHHNMVERAKPNTGPKPLFP